MILYNETSFFRLLDRNAHIFKVIQSDFGCHFFDINKILSVRCDICNHSIFFVYKTSQSTFRINTKVFILPSRCDKAKLFKQFNKVLGDTFRCPFNFALFIVWKGFNAVTLRELGNSWVLWDSFGFYVNTFSFQVEIYSQIHHLLKTWDIVPLTGRVRLVSIYACFCISKVTR